MTNPSCWYCQRPVPDEELSWSARLVPRSARRGGPVTLFRCPGCGMDSLVERNTAGESLLVPPLETGRQRLRGEGLFAARKWMAENYRERQEFLGRSGSDGDPALPAPPPEVSTEEVTEEVTADPGNEDDEPLPMTELDEVLDAYEVFGLKLTARPAEIRKRYRELARQCHPDRVAGLDPEIRALAKRKFDRLQKAYAMLLGDEG